MSILNVDKIQPIGGGSTITVDATDIQASTGTIRASTFSGDVSATGIGVTSLNVTGVTTVVTLDANGDLDVDGHTNLDNVSIAGVTTFSTSPVVPNGGYYKGIINSGSQQKIVGGYISGSNTLRLGESMYLTMNPERLGLGINDPQRTLHLSSNNTVIALTDTAAGTNQKTKYILSDAGVFAVGKLSDDYNTATEHLYIDNDGHVIINRGGNGGTADVNADNFVIKNYTSSSSCGISILNADNQNSTLYFGNASDTKHAEVVWSDAANLFLIGTSNAGASIKFRTANQSDALTIDSSGNVDIATGALTISNDIKSSDDDFYVYTYKGGSDGQVRAGIQFDGNSQRLRFFTGTNERVRILTGGEFAIGGGGYVGQPFSLQTSSTNLGYMETTSTTRGVMTFRDGNSTQNVGFGCIGNNHVFMKDGNEKVRINSAGEVYIGSSTGNGQGKLFVNDSSGATTTQAHVRNANSTGTAKVFLNLDDAKHASVGLENGSLVFRNSTSSTPAERLRITSQGNIIYKDKDSGHTGGGRYSRTKTVTTSGDATSSFMRFQLDHGAIAGMIFLTASNSGYSVAKTYAFVAQYGQTVTTNLLADTGAYSGANISFTSSTTNNQHNFMVQVSGITQEVNMTVILGNANQNVTYTEL